MKTIENEQWRYIQDQLAVLSATAMQDDCLGGRPGVSGFSCIHCGSENPESFCRDKKIYRSSEEAELKEDGVDLSEYRKV